MTSALTKVDKRDLRRFVEESDTDDEQSPTTSMPKKKGSFRGSIVSLDSPRFPNSPSGPSSKAPMDVSRSELWSKVSSIVTSKDVIALPPIPGIDAGSSRHSKLHEEIDDILRSKGKLRSHEISFLPPLPCFSPRKAAVAADGSSGGEGEMSPTAPVGIPKVGRSGREQRFFGLMTTEFQPLANPFRGAGGGADAPLHVAFRFSFITLFFVGLACGKFKRYLRRKTQAEQGKLYKEILAKSVAARESLINNETSKQHTLRSARTVVQRARKEFSSAIIKAIRQSNGRAQLLKVNPALTLNKALKDQRGYEYGDSGVSSKVGSPTTARVELGQLLPLTIVGASTDAGSPADNTSPLIPLNNRHDSLITLVPPAMFPQVDGDNASSPRNNEQPPSSHQRSERKPSRGTASHSQGGDGSAFLNINKKEQTSSAIGSPMNLGGTLRRRTSAFDLHNATMDRSAMRSGGTVFSDDTFNNTMLQASIHRPPVYEIYADKNAFVLNTVWEEMQYIPLKEREKKSITYTRQAAPSQLIKFTQSIVPTSSQRVQVDFAAMASSLSKNGPQGDGESQDGGSTVFSRKGRLSIGGSQSDLPEVLLVNPDLDPAKVPILIPGVRSTERSYNLEGVRACKAVAKPHIGMFNFYEWRVRQNKALFHHLCMEHRELDEVGEGSIGPGSFSARTKEQEQEIQNLKRMRERIRRRAQDVGFNATDSATNTYSKFIINKELEHENFLLQSSAEINRLLGAKGELSTQNKKERLMALVEGGERLLVERFKVDVMNLDKQLAQEMEDSRITENESYITNWILTTKERLTHVFGGMLAPEAQTIIDLAISTARKNNRRDLTMQDLDEGVFARMPQDTLLSLPAQFALERLLPVFSSQDCKSLAEAKQKMIDLFSKYEYPFALITENYEQEHRELYGMTEDQKTRRLMFRKVESVQRLNGLMEPLFERQALVGLNDQEYRQAKAKLETQKFKEALAHSEDQALVKAASLERRTSTWVEQKDAIMRRRSTVIVPPLGAEGISPHHRKESNADSAHDTASSHSQFKGIGGGETTRKPSVMIPAPPPLDSAAPSPHRRPVLILPT